jgi:hypothetical protein
MIMKVFVVSKDVITDCAGEVIDNGGVVGVFYLETIADIYVNSVEETYMHKRRDYTIEEMTVL